MAVAPRLYARSLFQAALEKGRLDTVVEEFGDFVAAVDEVPELRALLANPEIDRDDRTAALRDILADADELVRNFLLLVAEKGRSGEVVEIAREFEALVAEAKGILDVELTTAVELSEKDFDELLARIGQASGREVRASREVDPDLVGGLVLQVGSRRLDASIRGRLERLRHQLITTRSVA
jgi:F-type H+-transporting ATPase subunit delta